MSEERSLRKSTRDASAAAPPAPAEVPYRDRLRAAALAFRTGAYPSQNKAAKAYNVTRQGLNSFLNDNTKAINTIALPDVIILPPPNVILLPPPPFFRASLLLQ